MKSRQTRASPDLPYRAATNAGMGRGAGEVTAVVHKPGPPQRAPCIRKGARITMSSSLTNFGFVGVGGRGRALLRALLKVQGANVVAVCDTSADHRALAIKAITEAGQPAPKEYSEWQQLLAQADVEAVVSALPCHLHHANYIDVIAAGKDLYGEKPMCLSSADCNAVVDAANASSQIVQIGFQRRADPRFIGTMGDVHGGELGELVEGRIAWSNAWGPLYGWFGDRNLSGDWMVEQAVHNWDVMNWANNSLPVRAMGLGRGGLYRELQPERSVTDYYSALVQYGNGVIVNIIHSWVAPGDPANYNKAFNDEYTRLIGTKAGIDFNSGTYSYRKELKKPDRNAFKDLGTIDNTDLAIAAFVNSVRTRKPPVSTVEHGRDSVLACLLVRESVYREGTVTMEELKNS